MTNELNRVAEQLWRYLFEGERPWLTPVLASATPKGGADARTVVLRHVLPETRELIFYSDKRLGKVPQLEVSPEVCLVIFDPLRNLQVRLYGKTRRECAPTVLEAWWARLPEKQREPYQVDAKPAQPPDAFGRENFAAFRVEIDRFHCLWLSETGNSAAEFTWLDGWRGRHVRP